MSNQMYCGRFRVVDSKGGEGSVDHTGLTTDDRECARTHSRSIREYYGFGIIGGSEAIPMDRVRGMGGGDESRGEESGWFGGTAPKAVVRNGERRLSETGDGLTWAALGDNSKSELLATVDGSHRVTAVMILRAFEC